MDANTDKFIKTVMFICFILALVVAFRGLTGYYSQNPVPSENLPEKSATEVNQTVK